MTASNVLRVFLQPSIPDAQRASLDGYAGYQNEVLFDGKTLRVFDGTTPGGFPLLSAAFDPYTLTDAQKAVFRAALGIVLTGMPGIQGVPSGQQVKGHVSILMT